MTELLEDQSQYKFMSFEYIATTEKVLNKIVNRWEEIGYVTNHEDNLLCFYSAFIPRAYGLPKLHKPDNPLRIIASTINSAIYMMASFLSTVIKQVIGESVHYVKNSWQFFNDLNKLKIHLDCII